VTGVALSALQAQQSAKEGSSCASSFHCQPFSDIPSLVIFCHDALGKLWDVLCSSLRLPVAVDVDVVPNVMVVYAIFCKLCAFGANLQHDRTDCTRQAMLYGDNSILEQYDTPAQNCSLHGGLRKCHAGSNLSREREMDYGILTAKASLLMLRVPPKQMCLTVAYLLKNPCQGCAQPAWHGVRGPAHLTFIICNCCLQHKLLPVASSHYWASFQAPHD
jgi:hypothetical protein